MQKPPRHHTRQRGGACRVVEGLGTVLAEYERVQQPARQQYQQVVVLSTVGKEEVGHGAGVSRNQPLYDSACVG